MFSNTNISIVIPVYNSQQSIYELFQNITNFLVKTSNNFEIIFVDDNSKDNSFNIMKNIYYSNSNIKCIKLKNNHGQQNAILCGMRHAKYDYIVTMDDDLQHNPKYILDLLYEIKKGFDVVYGYAKQPKQYPFYRNLGSTLRDLLFEMILHKPKNIQISSFRIMRRELLNKITKETSSFVYISAITLKYTKNIGNVIISHNYRKYGNSNYTITKLFKLFLNIYIYYSDNILCNRLKKNKPQYVIEEKLL